jgi:hypothetical protein
VTQEWIESSNRVYRVKLLLTASLLIFSASLPALAQHSSKSERATDKFDATAKQVGEMDRQFVSAIGKQDLAFLEKILAEDYFDTWQGEKRALSKKDAIASCKAGVLSSLPIEKERTIKPEGDLIAVEGVSKLIHREPDEKIPAVQLVHVRRLWARQDGNWVLKSQIRRLEGDSGEGEID